jgi:cytochrome c oxidase subunit II
MPDIRLFVALFVAYFLQQNIYCSSILDEQIGARVRSLVQQRSLVVGSTVLALVLAGCSTNTYALDPAGPAAARIADLWWLMFTLATLVFVGVMGLLLLALFRRRSTSEPEQPPANSNLFIIGGGVVLPVVVIALLISLTLGTLNALADRPAELTIKITGWQWWWDVEYPDQQFYTANEIHIPVGVPVRLELTSGDVVHNFWVPQLHGKFDLIPGRTQEIWIQADEPGVYGGVCAEYCGLQHANMRFVVVAEPADQFATWLEQQQQPAALPQDDLLLRGQQIFLGSACVYCHAISGTNANSRFGPDLTHLASRQTLAAGILENNRGNLAGWILNPHTIKPGNKMPPVAPEGEDLQALLAYLESLK